PQGRHGPGRVLHVHVKVTAGDKPRAAQTHRGPAADHPAETSALPEGAVDGVAEASLPLHRVDVAGDADEQRHHRRGHGTPPHGGTRRRPAGSRLSIWPGLRRGILAAGTTAAVIWGLTVLYVLRGAAEGAGGLRRLSRRRPPGRTTIRHRPEVDVTGVTTEVGAGDGRTSLRAGTRSVHAAAGARAGRLRRRLRAAGAPPVHPA